MSADPRFSVIYPSRFPEPTDPVIVRVEDGASSGFPLEACKEQILRGGPGWSRDHWAAKAADSHLAPALHSIAEQLLSDAEAEVAAVRAVTATDFPAVGSSWSLEAWRKRADEPD